jgi:hypothetical protein
LGRLFLFFFAHGPQIVIALGKILRNSEGGMTKERCHPEFPPGQAWKK